MNLQVSFLLFESQREHLKFQMEHYISKLMEIISSDSNRISYEQRELALGMDIIYIISYSLWKFTCNYVMEIQLFLILEAIVQLWRIPGLPAELYLNYDCGLYSTNLYEELMKLLSKVYNILIPICETDIDVY